MTILSCDWPTPFIQARVKAKLKVLTAPHFRYVISKSKSKNINSGQEKWMEVPCPGWHASCGGKYNIYIYIYE